MSLCVPSVLGVADGGLGRLQNCICRWYQGEKKNSYFTQGEKIRGSDNQWQLFASGIFLIFILFFCSLLGLHNSHAILLPDHSLVVSFVSDLKMS